MVSTDIVDSQPPQHISTLEMLRELDVTLMDATDSSSPIFQSVSLPNLETLSIDTTDGRSECPTHDLIALRARSGFNLRHLSLSRVNLTVDDLAVLLQCLPTLESLRVSSCPCVEDRLFQAFTFRPYSSLPVIRLLRLKNLSLSREGLDDVINGNILADMVESLSQQSGDRGTLFPVLEFLDLYLDRTWEDFGMLTFETEVEERLAAVRATGFLRGRP
ncbi:hypothetical protein C8R44DRAFT_370843 [Mycena epipterygia]|nr:hypothetical protein C8R44DRAFT_370843 [Mycena epipterygia]